MMTPETNKKTVSLRLVTSVIPAADERLAGFAHQQAIG
jgi:hypothetical protein